MYTAVSCVGATSKVRRGERQRPCKGRKRDDARQKPQRRGPGPHPRPDGEATGDLGKRRGGVDRKGRNRGHLAAPEPVWARWSSAHSAWSLSTSITLQSAIVPWAHCAIIRSSSAFRAVSRAIRAFTVDRKSTRLNSSH